VREKLKLLALASLLAVGLISISLVPSIAYADNVTSVNITMSGNMTISDINISNLSDAGQPIATSVNNLFPFIILFGLSALAYWHRDGILYILSGLGFLVVGVGYMTTNLYLGIVIFLAGLYGFAKAALDKGKKKKAE